MSSSSFIARANMAYALYVSLGPGRTLAALAEALKAAGVPISLSTLKRYSTQFHWSERLAEAGARAAAQQDQHAVDDMAAILARHRDFARAMTGAGGEGLSRLLKDPQRLAAMKPTEIVNLLLAGMRLELEATSASVDRKDVALSFANLVTTKVVELYQEIASEPDPELRAQQFAVGLDALVDQHLISLEEAES